MDAMSGESEEEILAEPEEDSAWLSFVYNGLLFLQENAWFIVAMALAGYYVWTKKFSSLYHKWLQDREIAQETAKIKKDPESYVAREEARLAAIQRLQEEYNKDAIRMQEIMKEKEEKKREEWLAKHSQTEVGRKLNEDFNPLMGNTGHSYRAPRRSACPGGSCNR